MVVLTLKKDRWKGLKQEEVHSRRIELTKDQPMEPNLKYHLKKMGKNDQIADAPADRPAIVHRMGQEFLLLSKTLSFP